MTDTDLRDRVQLSKCLGMHPQVDADAEFADLREGEHYEVVAYTDWADLFVPTVVDWSLAGGVDRLVDPETTLANARAALEVS